LVILARNHKKQAKFDVGSGVVHLNFTKKKNLIFQVSGALHLENHLKFKNGQRP
jgi:hypothetical protein